MDSMKAELLDRIVEGLDIPKSYYTKAVERHRSLGEWLCRPESKLSRLKPTVHSQGSFRYGTVVRPITADAEYDLDNVTTLEIGKASCTQKQIKELYGSEIRAYAQAHSMTAPVEEKNRCWRLHYADDASFHLDSLPCVPEDAAVLQLIINRNVPAHLAELAVAITDQRHPQYDQVTPVWYSSNPRGFAHWFEEQIRPSVLGRLNLLVEQRLYSKVEDVPAFEWKSPLQRSIQILKRHRDVVFLRNPELAPISMIITNLAARAYNGETDLWLALSNIVEKMPSFVNHTRPRVPNPADPAEDYADRWTKNPLLEQNFWSWHTQVRSDLQRLSRAVETRSVNEVVRRVFSLQLKDEDLHRFEKAAAAAVVTSVAPRISIAQPARPWGR